MENKIKRYVAVMLILVVIFALAGCSKKDKTNYDNYSYGLNELGFYEEFDSYDIELPDFSKFTFTCDEVIKWKVDYFFG
jgi:hypothetical protein